MKTESCLLDLSWHSTVRLMLDCRRPVILVGEPGVGKTSFALNEARRVTGEEPEILVGTTECEERHLWGYSTLEGDSLRWIDGPVPTAVRSGRWLVVEEFQLIPLEIRGQFLQLRLDDHQSYIVNPVNSERIQVHPGFRLLMTSNPESMSCYRQIGIARALYDGCRILEVPALGEKQMRNFLKHHFPHSSAARIDRVLELWVEFRDIANEEGEQEKSSYMSYRAAHDLLELLELGMDEDIAVQISLANRYISDEDLWSVAKVRVSLM